MKRLALLPLAALLAATPGMATEITILTPYISSIPTNEMAQSFKAEGDKRGWSTTIIDTRNDFGQLASRIEDTVNARPDAIVLISVDHAAVGDQVKLAHEAGIPVISLDGTAGEDVTVNVTSNNFDLGVALSENLIRELGGKGKIVKFFHSAHPGVHQRELGLDEVLKNYPDVEIVAEHYVKVPGPIDDSRIAMENILRQYGDDIDGVWAAFDDPGIGAELAAESERPDAKFIIMGIDGNEQAVQMIKDCTHFKSTLRQDFPRMAGIGAEELAKVLDGGTVSEPEVYVPAVEITAETLGVTCG
ncbi:sugar ABC transporter substrate-binding protein [Pseudogemmobacter sonorensis]|uniref:sugar ABC transporter substrate-binding protein n=1 Tax=Pseudogemmobacter sonorensis TaxID=2989681 RepID=UPI0036BABA73